MKEAHWRIDDLTWMRSQKQAYIFNQHFCKFTWEQIAKFEVNSSNSFQGTVNHGWTSSQSSKNYFHVIFDHSVNFIFRSPFLKVETFIKYSNVTDFGFNDHSLVMFHQLRRVGCKIQTLPSHWQLSHKVWLQGQFWIRTVLGLHCHSSTAERCLSNTWF